MEQGDLLMVLFGRNSDSPVAVLAPSTPGDCFHIAFEAVQIALRYMVPVFVLSDGYLANGAEPWKVPKLEELPSIEVKYRTDPKGFQPYARDPQTLARPWVKPGTPGLEHRIGGIEKWDQTGNISYDPENHHKMTTLRAEKVARIAQDIPQLEVHGPKNARLLVLGWGSSYGSIRAAVEKGQQEGLPIARAHLRHLNPFPSNLGQVLSRFERVLIPENNMGHVRMLIRSKFLVDAAGYNRVTGQPFKVDELLEVIRKELGTL
jgi:2-oxoglutarate ferredoxin oxidoreductase subunit alpha